VSRFNGSHGKGFMRVVREEKRKEAEERQSRTKHDRTKAHRLGRCDCEKS
jgi:hypothetical protein